MGVNHENSRRASLASELGGSPWLTLSVAMGVLLVITFAPIAYATTFVLPQQASTDAARVPASPIGPAGRLTSLPAGLPAGSFTTPDALRPLATEAFGPAKAEKLIKFIRTPLTETATDPYRSKNGQPEYPYHYRTTDELLKGVPPGRSLAMERLGAALISLASASTAGQSQYQNAGPTAFAVLNSVAGTGRCDVELDLLLLLATDIQPDAQRVRRQSDTAVRACPNDPTAMWILVQFLSQQAARDGSFGDFPVFGTELSAAEKAAEQMHRSFPRAAVSWTASGDLHLRAGLVLQTRQPFTSRTEFRAAVADYRQAAQLDPGSGAQAGEARALSGLGQAAEGIKVLRNQSLGPAPGRMLELQLSVDEAAGAFQAAATVADDLGERGRSAYSGDVGIFPSNVGCGAGGDYDANTALSTGIARMADLTVVLEGAGCGSGGDVSDWSFIPSFDPTDALVGSHPACPKWSYLRDSILAGHPLVATVGPVPGLGPDPSGCPDSSQELADVARVEEGAPREVPAARRAVAEDLRQNMWRWAGNFQRAEKSVRAWIADSGNSNGTAMLRLGEVLFLERRFDEAAVAFNAASRLLQDGDLFPLAVEQPLLDKGAALLASGNSRNKVQSLDILGDVERVADATVVYIRHHDSLSSTTALWDAGYSDWIKLLYYSRVELGDANRLTGQPLAAQDWYESALQLLPDRAGAWALHPEAVHNNLALVEAKLGLFAAAERDTGRAVSSDPANPVFLMTAGYVSQLAGRDREAASRDAAAVKADPGNFSAANDLGVEQLREGRVRDAIASLRVAVQAQPDFALGWFNLGIAYGRTGNLYASQGALARALKLDPGLNDRKREPTFDAKVYVTGLDLSRPLPPRWSLSHVERRTPAVSVGLLAVVLVVVRAFQNAGSAGAGQGAKWLDLIGGRLGRIRLPKVARHPVWAVCATVLTFCLPYVVGNFPGTAELSALAIGVLILSALVMVSRLVATRGESVRTANQTWPITLVVGPVASLLGAPLAPVPTVRGGGAAYRRLHAAAPLTVGILAAVLLSEAAALGIPLTHSLAACALIMAGSLLVPIRPVDGAFLKGGAVVAGLGVAGGAVLLTLGLV